MKEGYNITQVTLDLKIALMYNQLFLFCLYKAELLIYPENA